MAYAFETYLNLPREFVFLVGGLGLIVTTVLNPSGIAGGLHEAFQRIAGGRHPHGTSTALGAARDPIDGGLPTVAAVGGQL
jgi:hypothetical protein